MNGMELPTTDGRTRRRRTVCAVLFAAAALSGGGARAQEPPAAPPLQLVQPEGAAGAPIVITLSDALERAKANDATFLASATDAAAAREDRIQAKASLLPALSHTTQYLGTQ